ncbi:hypothetical protein [Sulfuricystis multivorans]|uniref:hypothetical protein n=1 Tax=Sulfuricystis multivorans TaxID=2211108 RepID=UPI000F820E07|nr:hypothetical protein [Sulfuricystis multivorans]
MAHLQHRRFPGSFLLIAAILAIPSLLYGFVSAAEKADKCAEIKSGATHTEQAKEQAKAKLKCE